MSVVTLSISCSAVDCNRTMFQDLRQVQAKLFCTWRRCLWSKSCNWHTIPEYWRVCVFILVISQLTWSPRQRSFRDLTVQACLFPLCVCIWGFRIGSLKGSLIQVIGECHIQSFEMTSSNMLGYWLEFHLLIWPCTVRIGPPVLVSYVNMYVYASYTCILYI